MAAEEVGERFFEHVLKGINLGMAVVEPPGRIAWANHAFDLAGWSRDESADLSSLMGLSGLWPQEVKDALRRALDREVGAYFRSLKLNHPTEHGVVYLDIDIEPLHGMGDGTPRVLVVINDVTTPVVDQERNRLLEEYFKTSPYPIQIMDEQHVLIDVNPALEKVYGYSKSELIGKNSDIFKSEKVPAAFYDSMWEDLRRARHGSWSGETITRYKDGLDRPEFLSISVIKNEKGEATHYLATVVNISELKMWEQKAAHADKLASIGQLAAGVAHEVNTPLANAMLVTESIRRRSHDDYLKGRLDTISSQLEAAARITRGLLDFARGSEPRLESLDLAAVTREAISFLKGKLPPEIVFEEYYPDEPVAVAADRLQLLQVITNVVSNASDAMDGKGVIETTVRAREHRAEIDVIDHGPGVPEELLLKIFDPFFTTKPEGKGTGLGLAICHGIMQSHHGTISARNVVGAGAGFRIALPASPLEQPSGTSDDEPRKSGAVI